MGGRVLGVLARVKHSPPTRLCPKDCGLVRRGEGPRRWKEQ